jgi:glycerol uptake facilitator-like aquaporin
VSGAAAFPRARRAAVEFVGTALLLATIVGSGISGERLAAGNDALALLVNSLATGAALTALILAFGEVSRAHFNPLVSLFEAAMGGIAWRDVPAYALAQLSGAFVGVATAHAMFGHDAFTASVRARQGAPQLLSEFIATFGLIVVIWGCARGRAGNVAFAVGGYIAAAYWFTGSTSFANPAVTLARSATNTFSGIRPADAPGFIVAQLFGGAAATLFCRWLAASVALE